MPYSMDENRDWLLEHISPDDVVLDVGAGAGIWAYQIQIKRGVPKEKIHAVEIFEPYIERFGLEHKYGKIFLGDFMGLAIPYNTYTTLILGDVLEHFEMSDALKVWEKARRIVGPNGTILLSTPIIDWPQGAEEGNVHESHLSYFDMQALKGLSGVLEHREGQVIGSVIAEGLKRSTADDLTVLITTIPPRADRLAVAYQSVISQTLPPADIIIQTDTEKVGAAKNRDNGIDRVTTKYVALLDDDDYFYSDHLENLYNVALDTDADIVYSWFDVVGGGVDPFPQNLGQPWNPDAPIQTTVTILAKTDVIREAGGYSLSDDMSESLMLAQGHTAGEDYRMVYRANKAGAKIVHVPKKTWAYSHWHDENGIGNTSGRPDRW